MTGRARRPARELAATVCPKCTRPSGTSLRAQDGAGLYCIACGHRWSAKAAPPAPPPEPPATLFAERERARDEHARVVARLEPEPPRPAQPTRATLTDEERVVVRALAEGARLLLARADTCTALLAGVVLSTDEREVRAALAELATFDVETARLADELCAHAEAIEAPWPRPRDHAATPLTRFASSLRYLARSACVTTSSALARARGFHGG